MVASEDDALFLVTARGRAALEKAYKESKKSLRAIAAKTGVPFSSLSNLFQGKQQRIKHLPELCKELRVPFYKTQPLSEEQFQLLDALERLLAAKGRKEALLAVETFKDLVAGKIGKDDPDGNGRLHDSDQQTPVKP